MFKDFSLKSFKCCNVIKFIVVDICLVLIFEIINL